MASKDIITRLKVDTKQHDSGLNNAIQSVNKYAKSVTDLKGAMQSALNFMPQWATAAGAVSAFGAAIQDNIVTARTFEKSLSGLSSITGVTGNELAKYKDAAIELGGSSTQTASQVVEAFKLIGSQKPELLKNSEALKDVTKNAITLAEAAGMEVPDAAKALTASLNIMGEGAENASRYINVLAAGSKEGSMDITGLTEVVFKAGQAAKMNSLSFEQFVAVAETIAPSFGSAAEAGTALNAMLLKLQQQTNSKFNPAAVGLYKALSNLKDANLSANESVKLVTETGYKALVPLLANIDGVKTLESKVTGTNTATEQAATNADNLDGALKGLESAWEKFNLTLNSSNGILKDGVMELTEYVGLMSNAVKVFEKLASDGGILTDAFNGTYKAILATNPQLLAMINGYKLLKIKIAEYVAEIDKVPGNMGEGVGFGGVMAGAISGITPNKTTSKVFNDNTDKGIRDHIAALKTERDEMNRNSSEYAKKTAEIERLESIMNPTKGVKRMKLDAKSLLGDTSKYNLGDLDASIPAITVPLKIDEQSIQTAIATINWSAEQIRDNWETAADAMSQVGSAMASIENPAVKVAGILAQAIATVIGAYAKNLAGDQTTKGNIWAFIAAAAASTISMIATISQMKSAGAFAEGGIIGGNSYSGDRLMARVNSGEAILNRRQQANALSLMDGGGNNVVSQPYVSGDKIFLGLNNYLKSSGRGSLVTSRG